MYKKKIIISLSLFFFLFLIIPFVSSQKFTIQEVLSRQGADYFNNGLVINSIGQGHVQRGVNVTFYMSAYGDDGKLKNKDDVECIFGYATPQGTTVTLLNESNFTWTYDDKIWIITMDGSTVTQRGEYVWNFNCEEGTKGGYLNGHFVVNDYGEGLETSESNTFNWSVLFLMLLFLMSLVGCIHFNHYIGKFVCYWVCHLIFVVGTFSVWQFNQGYAVGFLGLAEVWKVLFYVSTIAVFPMIILSVAWIFYIHLMNDDIKKMMNRGMDEDEAIKRSKGNRREKMKW